MRRSEFYNTILILLIILENLFLFVFHQNEITSQDVNSWGYFLSSLLIGIVLIVRFYKQPELVESERQPFKRKFWLLFVYLACLVTLNGFTIRIIKTTNFTYFSDIISAIQLLCKAFLSGHYPYSPDVVAPLGYHGPSNYLPMHWLPCSIAEFYQFDYRTITFAVWCIGALVVMLRSMRRGSIALELSIPILLTGSYLLMAMQEHAIIGATIEIMVAGYYMLLIFGINQKNFIISGLFISICLLSRYYIALWMPLWVFVLLVSGKKKEFLLTSITIAVCVSIIYIIPFLSKDWTALAHSFKDYEVLPLREWKHFSSKPIPIHLYAGTGFAYLFYEKYSKTDLVAGYNLFKSCFYLAIAVVLMILAVWYVFNRKKIHYKIFLLASFKIYLTVFLAFILVPYTYLMITANFVSIAILAEQSRYKLEPGKVIITIKKQFTDKLKRTAGTPSKIALIATGIILLYITFNLENWKDKNYLAWDPTGYYLYLPATFIYNDIADLDFYPAVTHKYNLNGGDTTWGVLKQPTGHMVDKYPAGTAIMEMPLFLLFHGYTLLAKEFPADGYSPPYVESICLSTFLWVIIGFLFLRKFLLRYFSEAATAITILLIAFGTNLYFYTVFTPGMSHPFSFAMFCMLLYFTDKLYETGKAKYFIAVGLILGMIALIRPTNLVVAIIPFGWSLPNGPLADRIKFIKSHISAVLAAVGAFLLLAGIQVAYYRYTSGEWFHYSYEGERFIFSSPQIMLGLFSYEKGWYIYTPIAFIATIGLIAYFFKNTRMAFTIFLYMAINVYVIFSWEQWFYGGGFSCRPLIEAMAIMAIPLAYLVQRLFSTIKLARVLSIVIFSVFITLNMFQSYQLVRNVLRWDHMNKAFYWRTFGKLSITDDDLKTLRR